LSANVSAADLGFSANPECRLIATNLWSGVHRRGSSLLIMIASHDTEIWRIHPTPGCGVPARTGAITMIVNSSRHDIDSYSRCLASDGTVGHCSGAPAETWTVSADGSLKSAGRCLASTARRPTLQRCSGAPAQHWRYALSGNLINGADRKCLSIGLANGESASLTVSVCGHNQPNQVWALPN
jgi:alpha-galactosidase